ncbi:DUF3987 domain-containing protein [Rufibacter tibetensis]|uniref:DUF3987 domain-containing protein n=1 Tax=Rufibacter tibetensis TaxID=512763 RepID=A0A0P0CVR5_9BACT|nr:DUF3987 domain-containing protein [Rufibacter tibetensis]ALI98569.1 hypothetical protein DC20_05785 [Rufibacter tibetensis]
MRPPNLLYQRPDLPQEYDGLHLAALYSCFPEFFKQILHPHRDPQELIIASFSALATSAALIPNVYTIYRGKRNYPYLNVLVIMPPASGKGALEFSRILLSEINRSLAKEYEAECKRYEHELQVYKHAVKKGTAIAPPTPPKLYLILISGNTTSARLIQQLADNGANIPLVMLETEIDAVSGMFSGEMGAQNSVIFRQLFQHESVSSARKGDRETLTADTPKMAIILSGTENQVRSLFKGNEDGLLSRFLILEPTPRMEWVSPRPRKGERPMEDHYKELSLKFLRLWKHTQHLEVEVKFTESQWDVLDKIGEELQQRAFVIGGIYAVSIARRHSVMAARFCTILALSRHFDLETCTVPDLGSEIYPTEEDFSASLELTEYSFSKSLKLFQRMPASQPVKTENRLQYNFFATLPAEFHKAEADALAQKLRIAPRTRDRWLSAFVQTGALERIGRGRYKKSPLALMAVAEEQKERIDNFNKDDKMTVTVEIEPQYVSFLNEGGDIIYDIRRAELGDANKYPQGYISTWVFDLAPKSWVTRELVLGLCEFIKQEVPDNKIDWEATYAYIDMFH